MGNSHAIKNIGRHTHLFTLKHMAIFQKKWSLDIVVITEDVVIQNIC